MSSVVGSSHRLRVIRCWGQATHGGLFREHLSSLRGRERSDSDVLGTRNDLLLVLFEQKGDYCLAVDLPFGHTRRVRSRATSSEAVRNVATQRPTQAALAAFVVE